MYSKGVHRTLYTSDHFAHNLVCAFSAHSCPDTSCDIHTDRFANVPDLPLPSVFILTVLKCLVFFVVQRKPIGFHLGGPLLEPQVVVYRCISRVLFVKPRSVRGYSLLRRFKLLRGQVQAFDTTGFLYGGMSAGTIVWYGSPWWSHSNVSGDMEERTKSVRQGSLYGVCEQAGIWDINGVLSRKAKQDAYVGDGIAIVDGCKNKHRTLFSLNVIVQQEEIKNQDAEALIPVNLCQCQSAVVKEALQTTLVCMYCLIFRVVP